MEKIFSDIEDFIKQESTAGLLLAGGALLAIVFSNTGLYSVYSGLLNTPVVVAIGSFEIAKPLVLWINDGLMAIFFFLIGLEVKREVLVGELSTMDQASLPIFAAIGGMFLPILVFCLFASGDPEALRGWAIPAATDIAFALAVLGLLGSRAPASLKILLLAIAIIDDLGAIAIIAVFFTADLSTNALMLALVGFAALVGLNRMGVKTITPYVIIGTFIWACVLKSGVHATLAGVFTAFTIPIKGHTPEDKSPLITTEKALHKWVVYLILPIFAFANAGISFAGMSANALFAALPAGIMGGLIIGKPLGVFGMAMVGLRTKLASLPEDLTMRHVLGAGCLTGIGFTMSLFIGGLAFDTPADINAIRIGVLFGSLVAGGLGVLVLTNPNGFFDWAEMRKTEPLVAAGAASGATPGATSGAESYDDAAKSTADQVIDIESTPVTQTDGDVSTNVEVDTDVEVKTDIEGNTETDVKTADDASKSNDAT